MYEGPNSHKKLEMRKTFRIATTLCRWMGVARRETLFRWMQWDYTLPLEPRLFTN
jgi:hypothetical protein